MSFRRALPLALAVLCGCGPREVVLADLPASGDGGFLPHRPCATNAECPGDGYCQKASCGASAGLCEHQPVFCPGDREPVCGCDGVTYWNDCLRSSRGVEASVRGECTLGASCVGAQDCPAGGASCARMLPSSATCGPPPARPGTCWVLPAVCPLPVAGEDRWVACGPPSCVGTCDALRSGLPYVRTATCP